MVWRMRELLTGSVTGAVGVAVVDVVVVVRVVDVTCCISSVLLLNG